MRLGRGTSQHVLVAGKTGSGKSTLLHILITNLALYYSLDWRTCGNREGTENIGIGLPLRVGQLAVGTGAGDDPLRSMVARWRERRHHVRDVCREKQQIDAVLDGLRQRFELPQVPVFIMANAEKRFTARYGIRSEDVAVRAIGDVVAVLLQPVTQGEFPQQEFTRAG
ncbi:MAG: FtsK/SpoIIIE domain-containing protein [Planctomycetota bacterium]|nr:FtsK/SpoIIIE domain-containing protein [Planctomycetota bacterium]